MTDHLPLDLPPERPPEPKMSADRRRTLCDGHACEYRCGLRASDGGCSHAYDGPHSHRVCRRCSGTGVDRAGGEL